MTGGTWPVVAVPRNAGDPQMRMPSVVHVAPYYPPHLGGMENVVKAVVAELAKTRPVRVLTTTCGAEREPRLERTRQLTVRRLRAREIANLPVAPGLLFQMLGVGRNEIVHVHIAQALVPEIVWLSRRVRGGKFIAHFHLDVAPSGRFGWVFAWYKRRILGHTLRAAARVITFSPEQAMFLEQKYGLAPDAVAIIPNGVSEEFRPSAAQEKVSNGPLRVLYVGRLTQQKAVHRLVDALAMMRQPVEAVLVGDGHERPAIEERLQKHRLRNVRLAGVRRGSELVESYQWADVLVLPSDREGMPLAALEALACGLPIVATDVVGNRDLLKEVGILVSPDATSIAIALDQLAQDPQERSELRRRALHAAREFTLARAVDRIVDLYDEVMA
jgi:D-inositol-3-phosphate glycosyltransferase